MFSRKPPKGEKDSDNRAPCPYPPVPVEVYEARQRALFSREQKLSKEEDRTGDKASFPHPPPVPLEVYEARKNALVSTGAKTSSENS